MTQRFENIEGESAFVARASTIRIGDHRDEVLKLLGVPDEDQVVMHKEPSRKEILGYNLVYYLPLGLAQGKAKSDRCIRVSLDIRGIVTRIEFFNIRTRNGGT